MRDLTRKMLLVAISAGLGACSPTPVTTLPETPASTQPMAHAAIPHIEVRAFGLNGSTEVTVTPQGLLTYRRKLPDKDQVQCTLQLTDAQIDELAAAAWDALQTPGRPEHVTDYRIFHVIGNESFDDDGPNPRFAELNSFLWNLVSPFEPKDPE